MQSLDRPDSFDHPIARELEKRILVLDGGMGTALAGYGLNEEDYRTPALADHPSALLGNYDLLCLSRPEIVEEIHRRYLEAGADVVSTNTFMADRVSQAAYGTAALAEEMNQAGAQIARRAVDRMRADDPGRPRFVAGVMGPTARNLSKPSEGGSVDGSADDSGAGSGDSSADVSGGGSEASYAEVLEAYRRQAWALIEGGADVLLIETVVDPLNLRAALAAIDRIAGVAGRRPPIMISATVTESSARTLSGQTMKEFWESVADAAPFSVGLNCAFGPDSIERALGDLSDAAACFTTAHPNAGLPERAGRYGVSPEELATCAARWAGRGWVNVVGGCCGTGPDHIAAIAKAVQNHSPRLRPAPVYQPPKFHGGPFGPEWSEPEP